MATQVAGKAQAKQGDKQRKRNEPVNAAHSITSADAIAEATRNQQILHYRKMGATLQQIADKFDITPGRVHQIVEAMIKDIVTPDAAAVKQLELERLDALQFSLWGPATKGDIGAITTILSIMNRRARYLGLDITDEVDPTGGASKITEEEAKQRLLARLMTIQSRKDTARPMIGHDGEAIKDTTKAKSIPPRGSVKVSHG